MKQQSNPKEAEQALEDLINASRKYGSNPEYVLAGGGNTSWKNNDIMLVKASGTSLGTIDKEGFVEIDLDKINVIWTKQYNTDSKIREAEVLIDLMAARIYPRKNQRPSVEALLHALIPYKYIIHTHPALVNGITCSKKGKQFVMDSFAGQAVWIPVTDPGYILAKAIRDKTGNCINAGNNFPKIIFLQNHGIFAAADTLEEIERIYQTVFSTINEALKQKPMNSFIEIDIQQTAKVKQEINAVIGSSVISSFTNNDLKSFIKDKESFEPLSLAFTPDHIVYYGYKPLFVEDITDLETELKTRIAEDVTHPKIIAVKNLGVFAVAQSQKKAELARDVFLDDVKIAVYSTSFGGHQFMPKHNIDFIRTWEVESYRASQIK